MAIGTARAMLEAFKGLAGSKVPRGLKRLADSPVVHADVARAEAKLGSAHAYLSETLKEIWDGVEGTEIIAIPDRARVRLACANATQAAMEVADYAYKAAGTDSIVPGSPFEREDVRHGRAASSRGPSHEPFHLRTAHRRRSTEDDRVGF